RQRRTCYSLCHLLYPVSAAHTSIFRMDSNSTSYMHSAHARPKARWGGGGWGDGGMERGKETRRTSKGNGTEWADFCFRIAFSSPVQRLVRRGYRVFFWGSRIRVSMSFRSFRFFELPT
ncbi:hypothetical protein T484DRAFT_1937605, partial [Baffinella frigidus]